MLFMTLLSQCLLVLLIIQRQRSVLSHSISRLSLSPLPTTFHRSTAKSDIFGTSYSKWEKTDMLKKWSQHTRVPKYIVFEEAGLFDDGAVVLSTKVLHNMPHQRYEMLSLKRNSIGPQGGASILRSSFNCTKILCLELNCIGDSGLRILPNVATKYIWSVEELNLRSNRISASGTQSLASALIHSYKASPLSLHRLQRLYLGDNPIGNEGIKSLSIAFKKLGNFSNLSVLDISNCEIGDIGISSLCEALPLMPNLRHLNLGRNKISSQGIKILCETLSLCSVISLDVRTNKIGDFGARNLGSLIFRSNIKSLHIGWNGLTPKGIDTFVRAFNFENKKKLKLLHGKLTNHSRTTINIDFSGNEIESSQTSNYECSMRQHHPKFQSKLSAFASSFRNQQDMLMMSVPSLKGAARSIGKMMAKSIYPLSLSLCGCGLNENTNELIQKYCPENSNLDMRFNI